MDSYQILLIEDNAEMADNISGILELACYHVIQALNGKQGVELAQRTLPDLILCDIMMPELDGYGVLHILQANPKTADIPFIFLTAKADKQDFRAGMNLGADDYITKPFDGVDLLKVVELRLKKKQLLKSAHVLNIEQENPFVNRASALYDFQQPSENRPLRYIKKKNIIFMEGQLPHDLFYIQKGRVKTYKIDSEGKELITGIHKEGDFLGYAPLLEDSPYHENAEALEEVQISLIPRSEFLDLIYSNREAGRSFMKLLSNNIEEMESRLLDVAYLSVRKRVANALLKINERFSQADKDTLITMARKDIANMVGTATESLNRTLVDFRNEGLIEISEKGLKIINKTKLENLKY